MRGFRVGSDDRKGIYEDATGDIGEGETMFNVVWVLCYCIRETHVSSTCV